MESKIALNLSLTLAIILISATSVVSFDITKLLQEHGDLSTFNEYLTQTGLAADINSRQTITVFALDNGAMGTITSKPHEVAKNILATHVILDYYDPKKLADLPKKESTLTTLFQSTGAAVGEQGSIKVTNSGHGDVTLGSAVNGAPQISKVVKSIVAEPYNISVIQISNPILTPGLDHISPAHSPKASIIAESPNKAHEAKAPSKDKDDMDAASPSPAPDGDKGGADKEKEEHKKSAAAIPLTSLRAGHVIPAISLMGLVVSVL